MIIMLIIILYFKHITVTLIGEMIFLSMGTQLVVIDTGPYNHTRASHTFNQSYNYSFYTGPKLSSASTMFTVQCTADLLCSVR